MTQDPTPVRVQTDTLDLMGWEVEPNVVMVGGAVVAARGLIQPGDDIRIDGEWRRVHATRAKGNLVAPEGGTSDSYITLAPK